MDSLRDKLDALQRLDATRTPAGDSLAQPGATPLVSPAAEIPNVLGGAEQLTPLGAYWRVETQFDHTAATAHALPLHFDPRDAESPLYPQATLLLDIETGGFAGTPVFLIGIIRLGARPRTVEQYLARDYPEERAVLAQFAQLLDTHDSLVSFNGRSFDLPFLTDRATLHRMTFRPPRFHLDLLHAARRRWKHQLPDCRLETLERHLLGRTRMADIPGRDVPDLFHHFIRTGNAAPLRGVLDHNRRDLIACAELLLKLCDER